MQYPGVLCHHASCCSLVFSIRQQHMRLKLAQCISAARRRRRLFAGHRCRTSQAWMRKCRTLRSPSRRFSCATASGTATIAQVLAALICAGAPQHSLADNSVQRLLAFSDDRYSTEAMASNFSNYDMRNLLVSAFRSRAFAELVLCLSCSLPRPAAPVSCFAAIGTESSKAV